MLYEIHQLKLEYRDFLFSNLEDKVWVGIIPCAGMYAKIYTGTIEVEVPPKGYTQDELFWLSCPQGVSNLQAKVRVLEKLYWTFNVQRPTDFKGHSLSDSDVIVLKDDEDEGWSAWFCDRIGFKKLEKFWLSPVEEAQNALIIRLTQEQNAFRAKLLKLSPTVILDHAAEYTMREDILYGFREIWELRPELVRVFLEYQGDLLGYLYRACQSRNLDDLEGLICLCGDGMLLEKASG